MPNNGLGMEYCKANELLGRPLEMFTTHRKGGGPSATAIRKSNNFDRGDMPEFAREILYEAAERGEIVRLDDFSDVFRYLLFMGDAQGSEPGASRQRDEGLSNRFRKLAPAHPRLTDLLAAVKTKRYAFTRLQRFVLRTVLGITPPAESPAYIRVLGFRKESADLVSEMARRASLPVLTSGAAIDGLLARGGTPAKMLEKELEAGDIYRLAYRGDGFQNNRSGYRYERGMGIICV
jgi:predicted nucleotidyltransferase